MINANSPAPANESGVFIKYVAPSHGMAESTPQRPDQATSITPCSKRNLYPLSITQIIESQIRYNLLELNSSLIRASPAINAIGY